MRVATIASLLAPLFAAAPAAAELSRITDRGTFLSMVQGRELSTLGVRLEVGADGSIGGRALGYDVRGNWTWENGFFCRSIAAGNREFPYNCQAVSAHDGTIRFQSDQGTGDLVDLRIR